MHIWHDMMNTLWRRHQTPWNWLVQALGAILICLSIWLRSSIEAWAGIGLIVAGLLDFHLPSFPSYGFFPMLVQRMIRAEVVWVNKPLNRNKIREALVLILGGAFFLGILVLGSFPGLGLTIGAFVLLRIRAANKDAGIDP